MWNRTLHSLKATFCFVAILSSSIIYSQQNIIADKDNTHPEISRQETVMPGILNFSASAFNGYNEIKWSSRNDQDVRKFVVEFSTDGINYQSAGEALASATGTYLVKHSTFEIVPLLYRLRMEDMNGRYFYSANILLEGEEISPIKIYPTEITGNTITIVAHFPVEQIQVYNSSGQQVYTKAVGGKSDEITVVVPTLSRGIYFMTFYGKNWKTTEQFIVR